MKSDSHTPSVNSHSFLPQLLTTSEVCRFLKVKESYVRDLRYQQRIPYIKIGHLVRYDPEQIVQWIRSGKSAETVSEIVSREL